MKTEIDYDLDYQPSSDIKIECESVAKICNQYDHAENSCFFEDDFEYNHLPCLFYARHKEQIIGFISIYIYDEQNAEMCCFVLPQYRRLHVFHHLFEKVNTIYCHCNLFINLNKPDKRSSKILSRFDFHYFSTEYQLELKELVKKNNAPAEQVFSFEKDTDNTDEGAVEFQFFYQQNHVGHCNAFYMEHSICIHDVEIFEPYRNKGFGYQCMYLLFNQPFMAHKPIVLHVTKENTAACHLYQKLGFQITRQSICYMRELSCHHI